MKLLSYKKQVLDVPSPCHSTLCPSSSSSSSCRAHPYARRRLRLRLRFRLCVFELCVLLTRLLYVIYLLNNFFACLRGASVLWLCYLRQMVDFFILWSQSESQRHRRCRCRCQCQCRCLCSPTNTSVIALWERAVVFTYSDSCSHSHSYSPTTFRRTK